MEAIATNSKDTASSYAPSWTRHIDIISSDPRPTGSVSSAEFKSGFCQSLRKQHFKLTLLGLDGWTVACRLSCKDYYESADWMSNPETKLNC